MVSLCWFLVVFERLAKDNFVLATSEVVFKVVFLFEDVFECLPRGIFSLTTPEGIKQPVDIESSASITLS